MGLPQVFDGVARVVAEKANFKKEHVNVHWQLETQG